MSIRHKAMRKRSGLLWVMFMVGFQAAEGVYVQVLFALTNPSTEQSARYNKPERFPFFYGVDRAVLSIENGLTLWGQCQELVA